MIETEFREWLDLETTRNMCRDLAYEFGDMVSYGPGCFASYAIEDDILIKILYAAYKTGYDLGCERWA